MAAFQAFTSALLLASAAAQMAMPVPGYFTVPATMFNRGGRVDFTGLSLGQVCKQIMMLGGKEALSDGMGMAAKWFHTQRINGQMAGGSDPQMQCLYSQATGATMPGGVGPADPGNLMGDYYDTVIEYPMILDPCTAPQCNGKVNPTILLMQAYAPMMMRMGGMGGMGGGMGGFGGGMGGMGGMGGGMGGMPGANPMSPFLSALMPQRNTGPAPSVNVTFPGVPVPAISAQLNVTAFPGQPYQSAQGNPMSNGQNPQMMLMMQQLMSQMFPGNPGQAPAAPNQAASGPQAYPFV